jgi:hypothetical protein
VKVPALAELIDNIKLIPGWEEMDVIVSFEGEESIATARLLIRMPADEDYDEDWDLWSFEDGTPGDTHFDSVTNDLKLVIDAD